MNERDGPAFPNREGDLVAIDVRKMNGVKGGVTKLELAAMFAMQGLLCNPDMACPRKGEFGEVIIAKSAVLAAVALFDELEKQK